MTVYRKRSFRRLRPVRIGDPVYRQVWRIVDGAVRDAFGTHPGYVPPGLRERTVRHSIVKRVTGALLGYVGAARAAQRRGAEPGP